MTPSVQAPRRRWVNREAGRYYEAELLRDLFGDWTVLTVWGGLGTRRGSHRYEPVDDVLAGEQRLAEIARVRSKRHYV